MLEFRRILDVLKAVKPNEDISEIEEYLKEAEWGVALHLLSRFSSQDDVPEEVKSQIEILLQVIEV